MKENTPRLRAVKALPSVPKHGNEARKGYGGQRRRWDERCSTCLGAREVRGINGYYPCPRCVPTTQEQARQQEAEHQERMRGVME